MKNWVCLDCVSYIWDFGFCLESNEKLVKSNKVGLYFWIYVRDFFYCSMGNVL